MEYLKFSLQAASSGALIIVEESSSYGNLQLLMVGFLSSLFFIIFQIMFQRKLIH